MEPQEPQEFQQLQESSVGDRYRLVLISGGRAILTCPENLTEQEKAGLYAAWARFAGLANPQNADAYLFLVPWGDVAIEDWRGGA